jgi:hypothetical protein
MEIMAMTTSNSISVNPVSSSISCLMSIQTKQRNISLAA